ncbi:translation elongation factor G [Schistosoma japonicum]|uniref:Translation elongation factor G n=1 Tax=Schistosoma japonicum TaxID=6182 RepID=A0A4Z2DX67_SCHJA|nr:translation elongation factor G [Schistosoma japonicum]
MNDLDNIDYLSWVLDSQFVSFGNPCKTKNKDFQSLREIYYPITLGDMANDTMNVRNALTSKRLCTFSPPAFGNIKRPGDDFYPWQCVLAEEAPALATTVYRQAVDKADFDCIIDESGKLHQPRTTVSIRRYSPKDNPPTSLGYLKESIKHVIEHSKLSDPNSKSIMNHYNSMISPIHQNLIESRLKRLQLEEKMLMQAEKLDMLERIRKPLPRWYTMRTPQFFYEARKHNQLLKDHHIQTM